MQNYRVKKGRKTRQAITAAILMFITLFTGTYSWQSFNQRIVDAHEIFEEPILPEIPGFTDVPGEIFTYNGIEWRVMANYGDHTFTYRK